MKFTKSLPLLLLTCLGSLHIASAQSQTNSPITCSTVGKLKEKFEQNGAKFERFSKQSNPKSAEEVYEWLKITLPNGSCKIIGNIQTANHDEVTFEDWNGDGMKDRIDNSKWRKKVSLFSKTKNDFSDKIEGEFCGKQSDYDKAKGLKWQFLEDKFGGVYQLYKMEGLKLRVLSEIDVREDDNGTTQITILKSPSQPADKKVATKTFLLPPKNGVNQTEASVKRYWDSIAKTLK